MVAPVVGDELALRTQVVLDVTGAGDVDGACELVEDLGVVLADDVRHHVQAAAVRHTYAHLVELFVRGLLADLVQQDDDGFTEIGRAHV